ncbi:MAG: hypothetical protein EA393_03325 [Bacteroidetes bacterium]|nr:MAG: hypothetical protein EA393_03325 [Bacteroidota bacterium]
MGQQGVERFSKLYFWLKKYVDFCYKRFYKVRYINKSKELNTLAGIFVSNHQNASMDPLAILTSFTWQPVFLARADIFNKKPIARILRFLKILPVYRIRDGFDQLSNNQEIFDQTFQVFENGSSIVLFPEGTHSGKKQVQNLKKGVARIAFSYRHNNSKKNEIKIIPIGLNYESYHDPGSQLIINFGEPLSISAYDSAYAENPAKAVNSAVYELKNQLQNLSLHIKNDDIYPVADFIAHLYFEKAKVQNQKPGEILSIQKKLITNVETLFDNSPEEFEKISNHADRFMKHLGKFNIKQQYLEILFIKNRTLHILWQSLLLMTSLPLYIYAFINNIIPVLLIRKVTRMITDTQFKSSVLFVGSILVAPVIHLIQAAAVAILLSSLKWGLVYLLSLPLSYWFKLKWERLFKRWKNSIKLMRRFKNIREDFLLLKEFISF